MTQEFPIGFSEKLVYKEDSAELEQVTQRVWTSLVGGFPGSDVPKPQPT